MWTVDTMRHPVRFCLALLVAACAAAPLAAQPEGEDPALREAQRPFDSLMRHRAALGLTEAQVSRLEALRAELEQRNGPLRRQLTTRHQQWREERRAELERMSAAERRAELRRLRQLPRVERVPEDMRPIVRQMRVNIEDAMHRVQGVLTAEQRLQARRILQRELREARPRARPRAQRPARRMEERAGDAERRAAEVERRAAEAERRAGEGRQP